MNKRRRHYEHAADLAVQVAEDETWLRELMDEYRRYPALSVQSAGMRVATK